MRAARWTLRKKLCGGVWLAMSALGGSAGAYDISTHALIAEKAYQRSVLNPADPNSVVNVLGFDRLDPTTPFVDSYFDNQATSDIPTQFTRFQQPQETAI